MRRLAPLAVVPVALVLVLGTCDDQPTIPVPQSSSRDISDAVYDAEGNPHFFWLPPLVPEPETFNGPFDGDSDPVVTICELTDAGCTVLVHGATGVEAVYTVHEGPGGVVVQVDPVEEHFLVTWHTDEFNTATETAYQIQVTLGSTLLGFADVTLTETGKEVTKKNEIGEETVIALKDGRTLPVTFRVEEGAICANPTQPCTTATVQSGEEKTITLTDEGGQVFSELRFPSGWAATDENDEPVDALTMTMEKRPVDDVTNPEDPSCLNAAQVNDPETGQPANCPELRADTDEVFDIQVTFDPNSGLPVLTFCPDDDVLASDNLGQYMMTSVEEDVADPAIQDRRTYNDVAGLSCTETETTVGFGEGSAEGLLAMSGRLLASVAAVLLPEKLWAIDGGFGGELDECCTIFFYSRAATEVSVSPSSATTQVEGTVDLDATATGHGGGVVPAPLLWFSSDDGVATVDASGVVSGISAGTATITAAASLEVSGSATVTVEAAPVSEPLRIAFASGRGDAGNFFDLYTMNDDGTDPVLLFSSGGVDAHPSWSPDGTKVTFWSNGDGTNSIYVINADGTGVAKISGVNDSNPAWSPGGTRIAFQSLRDQNLDIYVMNADGTNATRLTTHAADDETPSWSPDGTEIVFMSERDEDLELYRMNADGSGTPTRLTNSAGTDALPAWSPDGSRIAFLSNRDDNSEVHVLDLASGSITNLTNDPSIDTSPAWSPDGTKIAFKSLRDDSDGEIYVMNADGSGTPTRLTNSAGFDGGPAWQPPTGFGTATVDGVRATDEWSHARKFSVFSGDPEIDGSTLFVMNDGTNLYLALHATDPFSDDDSWEIRFDNANNDLQDAGDDELRFSGQNGFRDGHFDGSSWGILDATSHGAGAAAPLPDGDGFFELSHPLDSGDGQDISLIAGDVFGLCIRFFKDGGSASSSTDVFPPNCVLVDNEQTLYQDVRVADGGS